MFDETTDRRHTNSVKWNVADNELPMWIGDMDFTTAPCVRRAIEYRAAHGIFGYSYVPDDWAGAYIGWWQRRHGFTMERDWLVFCTGVIPAISTAVRKLTTPAEKVVLMTPVYGTFFNCVVNNGRYVLEAPLHREGNRYSIDWAGLEQALADPQTALLILCNPHNPTGNIWTKEELVRIGELCAAHGVLVISDEIHCDLTDPGTHYTPFAAASETNRRISVTCMAASKAFNIAGLQTAAICVPDAVLRHKMWRGLNTDEVAEPNAFATLAPIAAFTEGEEWLESLRAYIYANKQEVAAFLAAELPQVTLTDSQASYFLWLNCAPYGLGSEELVARIRKSTGLFLTAGKPFGGTEDTFLRLNIACPRAMLRDGLNRLKKALESL